MTAAAASIFSAGRRRRINVTLLLILGIILGVTTQTHPQNIGRHTSPAAAPPPRVTSNHTGLNMSMQRSGGFCVDSPKPRSVFYSLFLLIVLIVALTGNIIVVCGIGCSRMLRSRVTNYFVISLAVSDIAVCLVVMPVQIASNFQNQAFCLGRAACVFHVISDGFLHVASVTNLLLIAIDRFIAVVHPYRYASFLSSRHALYLIALAWLYSLVWGCLAVVPWEGAPRNGVDIYYMPQPVCVNVNPYYYTTITTAVYLVPLVVMGTMYLQVLRVAIKQARAIAALVVSDTQEVNMRRRRREQGEFKATKTVMIVYGTFVICWLPVCIISISASWCTSCWLNFRRNHKDLFEVVYLVFTEFLPPLNSTLNPFIYVLFGQQFRSAFKMLFLRMLGRTSINNEVTDRTSANDTNGRRITLHRIFRKSSNTMASLTR